MYDQIIGGLWLLWCFYWFIAAGATKSTARRESLASRATHLVPLVIGLILIASPRLAGNVLSTHVLPPSRALVWAGIGLMVAGLGFTVWARVHLGANWSGTVTLKESHELIRSGPYAWVRHPIYTGLLTAILGNAIARDEWRAVIGFALVVASLVWKLRLEERWMREIFGEQYVKYAREVRALVPGVY